MANTVTINTVQRSFISMHESQRFSEGADYRSRQNRNVFHLFINWLAAKLSGRRYDDNTVKEISDKRDSLNKALPAVAQAILKAKTNEAGGLDMPCEFTIEEHDYQLASHNGQFVIVDKARPGDARELPVTTLANLKREMLIEYLETERANGNKAISLSEFDLTGVDFNGVDLAAVTPESLDLITAGFQRDFLATLTDFSKTVTEVITMSSTRDEENGDISESEKHLKVIDAYRSKNTQASPGLIKAALQSKTGNCGEMAQIGKSMCDLYLSDFLKARGYNNFSIKSSVISQGDGTDHAAVSLECTLYGVKKRFVLDPWSGGQAWTEKNALSTLGGEEYTSLETLFSKWSWNSTLEANKNKIKVVFEEFGIKARLDSNIQKSMKAGQS